MASLEGSEKALQPSERIMKMSSGIMDTILEKYAADSRVLFNLAQGMFFLGMSKTTQLAAQEALHNTMNQLCSYGDVLGWHPLRKRWLAKILLEWDQQQLALNAAAAGLSDAPDFGLELMITAGANQAFMNTMMALCNPEDEVITILPYYWSHVNAIQAAGCVPVFVPCDRATFLPTIEAIESKISSRSKVIVLVNPGNPSGVVIPPELIDEIASLCRENGIWLVLDEAYKEFVYDPDNCPHYSPPVVEGVVKLYTMSKVYGLAGWRVGACLYPQSLSKHMRKVQDTIPTHSCKLSDVVAYAALNRTVRPAGSMDCVSQRVAAGNKIRLIFLKALLPVYENLSLKKFFVEPTGAFYMFIPIVGIDPHKEDVDIIEFLVEHVGVLLTPGSAFGMPDYIRVAYGRIGLEFAQVAATALAQGLADYFELVL